MSWAAALIAGAALSGGALAPHFFGAATEGAASQTAKTEAGGSAPAPEVSLIVAPIEPVVKESNGEAKFSVLLRNPTKQSVPEGSVELTIGARRDGASALPTAEDLATATPDSDAAANENPDAAAQAEASTGAGAGAGAGQTVIATAQIDALAAGKEHAITVTVPLADIPAFTAAAHGVYPVVATYRASDSGAAPTLKAFTPVVWEGPSDTQAQVELSTIVPLTLPASVQSMPTRAQLGRLAPALDALVDYATRTQATLAIDPRITTAIRVYGTQAPQAAQDLLARLESTPLASFMLQYGDADPAAQAALGATALMQPNGFEFIERYGAWQVPDDATPGTGDAGATGDNAEGDADTGSGTQSDSADSADSASADQGSDPATDDRSGESHGTANTSDPAAPTPPSLDELNAWPNGLAASWPAPGQVDQRTLDLTQQAGLGLTVLRSDNVALTGGPRATLSTGGDAVITDAELESGIALALSGVTETERALGGAQASARLALAATSGEKALALGIDRAGITTVEGPESLLSTLTTQRWVKPVAQADLPEGTAQLAQKSPIAERIELLQAAIDRESEVLEVRQVLVNPEYLDGYQRARLLAHLSARYASEHVDFTQVSRQYEKRDEEILGGVRLVPTKRAQMVGASTRIPIQLRNELPFDAIVTLEAAPTSAALSVPDRVFTDILLPEDSSERVLVPTSSRVSTGDSALQLTLTSTDREFVASTSKLEISISSAVETVAIAIFGTLATLLLGFGIWRSVRRRRTLSAGE